MTGGDGVRVRAEARDGVGRLTFDAPERLNAVDAAMLDAALAHLTAFDADPAVRVITVTGAGRGFCSGANLGSPGDPGGGPGERDVDDATLYAAGRLTTALLSAATPTLALVNGIAAGVGVSIALACHYVLATESASFMLAFAKIGLMPDGGATALVAANVGRARALRMALTAEKLPARTAEHWGLIAECATDDAFTERSAEVTALLAASAPGAVRETTAAVNAASVDLGPALALEESGQARLLRTADFAEGVEAFGAKRPAVFRGR